MQDIVVYHSRARTLKAMAGWGIPMLIGGFFIIGMIGEGRVVESLLLMILCGVVSLTCGSMFLIEVRRLLSPKPAFAVTREGITDEASFDRYGFIPWGEIAGLKCETCPGGKELRIAVRDFSRLERSKVGGGMTIDPKDLKRSADGHQLLYVQVTSLPVSPEDLLEQIERFRNEMGPSAAGGGPGSRPPAPIPS